MLLLEKGTTNTLIVTVTEKVTIETPVFLLWLKSDVTHEETSCIVTDTSSFPERYNSFSVTETDEPDNLEGEISLSENGFYHYEFYEQSDEENLDKANATTLLESGKMEVIKADREIIAPATEKTYKTYKRS